MVKHTVLALTSSDMIEYAIRAALDKELFDVSTYLVQSPDNYQAAHAEIAKKLSTIAPPDALILHEYAVYSSIFDLASDIKIYCAKSAFILLSQVVNPSKISRAVAGNFLGIIAMNDNPLKILSDLTLRTLRGKLVLSDTAQEAYAVYLQNYSIIKNLPQREIEVLNLMLANYSTTEISNRLKVESNNIHQIQWRLRRSFNIESNDELIRYIRSQWNDLTF